MNTEITTQPRILHYILHKLIMRLIVISCYLCNPQCDITTYKTRVLFRQSQLLRKKNRHVCCIRFTIAAKRYKIETRESDAAE